MSSRAKTLQNITAFTLVELLVVMAISAVLFTLGLSAAYGAIEKTHSSKCLSSLRQVGMAIQLYVGDNSGRLPDTGHIRAADGSSLSWTNTLSAYLSTNFIGRCPVNRKSPMAVTYGWNDLLTETSGDGIPVTRCRLPSTTLAVAEAADTYTSEHFHFASSRTRVTYNQFKSAVGVDRHGTSANYLFVDGHTELLSLSEIKNRLAAANSTFLTP
ncbi:MAG: prepilin-type N-terminal cleavage/methylation domain-containing protein [Terrimicrobiaceae bacterium]